ncbi:MAG: DUF4129 domain-containing protein [Ruminiclostridium sp.]|nr:DUF4129 domain-containing protein [Ruminiclostridium sp.]
MRSFVLKTLAVLSFAAVVFPFLFGCDINTYGDISVLRMLYYYGIGAVIFLLGYVSAAISKSHKKLRIPLRIAGALMFGVGFLSLPIGGDGVTVFAFGVCSVFAYFIGERAGYKNFADMFPLTAFAFYIVLAVGCYIFVRVAANEEISTAAADTVVAAFAAEFAAAALLVNQSGIFDRANMRKETRSSLPKGLTAYNAALILGFTVTALALCVFRKQVAQLLSDIGIILVKAIVWFLSLFNAESMETEASSEGEIGAGWAFYEYSWYLLEAFAILVMIALAIIFRKQIFGAIKGFFSWLGMLFSGRPEESARPEFIDVFENFSSGRRSKPLSDNIYAVHRRYAAEKDPVKKFRYGYRVLLFRIRAVNQRLTPADTVSVQAERGEVLFPRDEIHSVADTYDEVRYGDHVPTDDELTALSGFFSPSKTNSR